MFAIIWAALFVIGLVVEGFALANRRKKDTLSEQVWLLRTKLLGRVILLPLWAWLTWHFFLEPAWLSPREGRWGDDFGVVVLGLLAGLTMNYASFDVDVDFEDGDV